MPHRAILLLCAGLLLVAGCSDDTRSAEADGTGSGGTTDKPTDETAALAEPDDVAAGTAASITLRFDEAPTSDDVDRTIEVLRSRIDALGIDDPDITVDGETVEVVVTLSAPREVGAVAEVLAAPAQLSFRPVLTSFGPLAGVDGPPCTLPAGSEAPGGAPASVDAASLPQFTADGDIAMCFQVGPPTATGSIIETAAAEAGHAGDWMVALTLVDGPEGTGAFNEAAGSCFARDASCPAGQLAITLDDRVVSAPTIQQPAFDAGAVTISGGFDETEAEQLAVVLRSGALPSLLTVSSVQTR